MKEYKAIYDAFAKFNMADNEAEFVTRAEANEEIKNYGQW